MFEAFLGINPWTSLFILLNTLTILWVAKKYLFTPVMRIISERQREIDGMYENAGKMQQQAESLQAEYQHKLSTARTASEQLVKEAVARGQTREEEIIRNAKAEAAAILDKARADIAAEKKKAMEDTKREIEDLSLAIAGKVLGRELQKRHQKGLIDCFIDELGESL